MRWPDPVARFWSKINKNADGCWRWGGVIKQDGYGVIIIKSKETRAHRLSWQIHNGEIADGLFVLHQCDNRSCVNPNHLFLGNHVANMLDMVSKGRGFQNKKKFCPKGHPYDESNTRIEKQPGYKSTARKCIACKIAYDKKRWAMLRR